VRISAEWLDDAPNAAPDERATVCDLRIWIGETNVTTHLDIEDQELFDHVTVPTFALADGIAHDWWRILGGRDAEHKLVRHRMGYALPDVRFRFDGVDFVASAPQRSYQNPNIRFWSAPDELLTRPVAERVLSHFVEETIDQLAEHGLTRTGLNLRWGRVKASRQDPDEAFFCEAAGAMDLDPYAIEAPDAAFIQQAGRVFDGEALIEFLAGLARSTARSRSFDWISKVEGRPASNSVLPSLADVAKHVAEQAPTRATDRSWALGYRRARATRSALKLYQTDRIADVPDLAERFGGRAFRHAPPVSGLLALVVREANEVHVHLRDRRGPADKFAFGRAIGDAICFQSSGRSVVNDLRDAARQAAGRAFAAEFLAPVAEILSMQDDGEDLEAIADEFGVATEVISRQVENAQRIEEACAT
jgi:hypothetical protein